MTLAPPLTAAYDVAALRADQFPLTAEVAYLNHAGISPLPRRTAEAMSDAVRRLMMEPSNFAHFIELDTALHRELAALINAASPDEIAAIQSTSLGISLIAQAMPWQPGQNIVLCDTEFPSNAYPWMRLTEQHGVEVRLLPARDGGITPDMLPAAVDAKTRLVAASALQFLSGHRTDLQAIGDFCRERGILFSVDAIQSVCHMPIDVQAMNISILVAGGQKSLMGPAGQGFLYVRSDLAATMRPTVIGSNATVDFQHWLKYDMTPLPAAARFGTGTPNVVGIVGLLESVRLLRGLGIANIDQYTTALAEYAIQGLRGLGFTVITPAQHGPIVTFRAAEDEAKTDAILAGLSARKIVATKHWDAPKNPYIRVSFHCYNNTADIDRLLAALKELKDA
jgi:selenocysteine lyase/cysteine desulfurase